MTEPNEPGRFEGETTEQVGDAALSPIAADAGGVTDPYVARRVAEHAAAQAEAEQEARGAEVSPQGSMLFYVLLGIVIATLLTVVIFATEPRSVEPAPPSPSRPVTAR